jgi:hypothetical protein
VVIQILQIPEHQIAYDARWEEHFRQFCPIVAKHRLSVATQALHYRSNAKPSAVDFDKYWPKAAQIVQRLCSVP